MVHCHMSEVELGCALLIDTQTLGLKQHQDPETQPSSFQLSKPKQMLYYPLIQSSPIGSHFVVYTFMCGCETYRLLFSIKRTISK